MGVYLRTHVSAADTVKRLEEYNTCRNPNYNNPWEEPGMIFVIPRRTDNATIHTGMGLTIVFSFYHIMKNIKKRAFPIPFLSNPLCWLQHHSWKQPKVTLFPSPLPPPPAQEENEWVFSSHFVPWLLCGALLTAIDRGTRLAGVPPGLPQGAAAGGAAHANSNLGVAGQTPVSSRPELQVAIAHSVVCRATQELKS